MYGIIEYIKHKARRLRASFYVGHCIGEYRVEQVMGAGSFGMGFKARSQEDGREVFLKLIDGSVGESAEDAPWPEVAALSKCDHPGIPSWLGVVRGKAGERFIVQSLMPGESLANMLAMGRVGGCPHAFTMQEIALVGGQLVDVLAHAFSRGVIHGDMRPSNVLFNGAHVSLVDFGFACFFDRPAAKVVFETDAMIDRMGLADTMLFLLYSDPQRVMRLPGSQSVWMNELNLTDAQRQLLLDLFAEDCRFSSWDDVRSRFNAVF